MEIGIPVPACGDGMRDRSAGEQCDRGGDSATCDRDCTLPACGDGLFNPLANEQCDEGGDDSATCDGDCTLPVCGDGHVNAAADEACDDGIESAACDRDCSMPACGDGIENTLAGETCDDGDLDETDACTTRCQRAQCGDGFTHGGMEACDDGNTDDTDECMPWCAAAGCLDGLRNGGETDLDCGGGCDVACGAGQRCASEGDCASGRCSGGQCVADRLDAGNWHTCALLESGAVRCWGRNRYGQLGYGHTSPIGDSEAPSSAGDVSAGERVVQLAAGAYHTCALLESGTVRCWGDNEYGRLGYGHSSPIGDNEAPSSVNPVDVGGRVVQLAAGDSHTCALLEGGAVRCWGPNWNGELGYGHMRAIGDDESPSSAGDVNVGGRVVQLAAGSYHTCAVLEGGGVRCWGYNENGQLGYGHMRAIGDDESPSSASCRAAPGMCT
jgi:cysteine-rich repeat protein